MTTRRDFLRASTAGLAGILACKVAPAAIGSNVLMPVRKLVAPNVRVALNSLMPVYVGRRSAMDWTPARLFDGRTGGFWIDPNAPNGLIRSATGEVIGCRDLSGNGNHMMGVIDVKRDERGLMYL